MLIVGASGQGESTLLMRLLLEKNLINYDKVYILLNHFIKQNIKYYNLDSKIN